MLSSASRAVACFTLFLSIAVHSLPSPSLSSERRWLANQVNETMCWWNGLRGSVIRDTMYLDGGKLAYLPGLADGTYAPAPDEAPRQLLYYINFTQPFNTSQNFSQIIRSQSKPDGNLAPNYNDGTMFSNDNEFYLFGGLIRNTDSASFPDSTTVLGYERFQYGPFRESWVSGWNTERLPSGMTRYIYGGAGTSIPSENLGFYFSGLRRTNWTEIRDNSQVYKGNVSADTLVSIDMSVMRSEKWTNASLPSGIDGRAGAELAWIPVSTRGVLLAIGGVINPEFYDNFLTPAQMLDSQNKSPAFMKQISVYDVGGQKWYTQDTIGDIPGALAQFCSVVAPAKDGSSYSVYIYGGYTAKESTEAFSDDVYVLSVPSFIWTKVYSGTARHGRIRHKCAKPYPDQMFVVGGSKSADPTDCLDGGMVQIFNLNSLTWQTSYDPTVWSEYKVPDVVVKNIGGNSDGGATKVSPSTWGDGALSTLFGAKYTKTVPTYYPYSSVPVSTGSTTPQRTNLPLVTKSSKGVPSWVAPVLGVVLGLVAISAIVTCALLYRRRKLFGKSALSEGSQSGLNHRIMSWMGATPLPPKPPTVTTTEDLSVSGITPPSAPEDTAERPPAELHSHQVFEMAADERPVEVSAVQTASQPPMRQVSFVSNASHGDPRSPQGIPRSESPTTGASPPVSPQHRHRHSHTVSDVSASSDLASPDRNIPSPLGYTPEVREQNSMDHTMASPISPPTDERGNPMDRDDQRLTPTVRGQQNSPTRRTSQFGENF